MFRPFCLVLGLATLTAAATFTQPPTGAAFLNPNLVPDRSSGLVSVAKNLVEPKIPLRAVPFDLADVRLGPGPFRDAMERDKSYLLRLDPDRLLHTFRLNVGLVSTAQPYGGWEAPTVELRGHTLGHYLTACALMYASTGDAELKRRIDYIVGELARCQAASPRAGYHEGYLSAYPESFIDRVETGPTGLGAVVHAAQDLRPGYSTRTGWPATRRRSMCWSRAARWIAFRVDRLTPEQMQASLQTEFGGMNDVLANPCTRQPATYGTCAGAGLQSRCRLRPAGARRRPPGRAAREHANSEDHRGRTRVRTHRRDALP